MLKIFKKKSLFFLYSLFLFSIGFYVQRKGFVGEIVLPTLEKVMFKISNKPFDGETIYLEINKNNFEKLNLQANRAIKEGYLSEENKKSVKAKIIFDNDTSKATVRLKGHMLDHLQSKKHSYRINVKSNKSIMGLKKFSLQHPSTKNFLNEWIFHKFLKYNNFISLDYKFIRVVINSRDFGIYALEQGFDKILLEKNQKKESVIIRFDEEKYFDEYYLIKNINKTDKPYIIKSGYGGYMSSEIDAFQTKKTNKNPILNNYYQIASNLLTGFRDGKYKAGEVFDLERLSLFLSICEIFSAYHATAWTNLRFYYNPFTEKLEPIGFDASIGGSEGLSQLGSFYEKFLWIEGNKLFYERLFSDNVFSNRYLQQLNRLSSESLFELFLKENEKLINREVNYLKREWNDYSIDFSPIKNKSKYIKSLFSPKYSIIAYLKNINKETVNISIGNQQIFPINEISLVVLNKNNVKVEINLDKRIKGKKDNEAVQFEDISFKLPKSIYLNNPKELSLKYKIIGTSKYLITSVVDNEYKSQKLNLKSLYTSNHLSFPFIYVSNESKKVFFKKGSHKVKKSLFFPKDKLIIIPQGTTLNFLDSSFLYSNSPILCLGEKNEVINLTSSDSSSIGLFIIDAKIESKFKFTNFSNFKINSNHLINKTGALTFYKSPVNFNNCSFIRNSCEDALNIVQSNFKIEYSKFINNKSDSFDSDFCSGILINSFFKNSGNDGIDLSGSNVILKNLTLNNTGDKAISIGESSIVNAKNIQILNSTTGIACKDRSHATISDLKIENTGTAISAFIKKSEYGPSKIEINKSNFINCQRKFSFNDNSEIIVDSKLID